MSHLVFSFRSFTRNFTVLVVFFISCMSSSQAWGQQSTDAFHSIVLQVKGVGCNEDVKSIAANVEKLWGVVKCKPLKRGATTKFEVDFDPGATSKQEIYTAVENTPGCKDPKQRPYKVKNKDL